MKIEISRRDRPFAHIPGTLCLLPRTCWVVQAFPALIRLMDREKQGSDGLIEIPLQLTGPVREFTVQQDLEAGAVWVWGVAREGRFRFKLQAVEDAIELFVDRSPLNGLVCNGKTLQRNESLRWKFSGPFMPGAAMQERLSLGMHRAQDWASVWKRFDFCEIFPILFHLGRWIPETFGTPRTKMFGLLDEGFDGFLRAAFSGILSPRLSDEDFQGLLPYEKIPPDASCCSLVIEAARRVRSLFIVQNEREISLLPGCEFDAGRMTNVCQQYASRRERIFPYWNVM